MDKCPMCGAEAIFDGRWHHANVVAKSDLRKPMERWDKLRTYGNYSYTQLEELLNEVEEIINRE